MRYGVMKKYRIAKAYPTFNKSEHYLATKISPRHAQNYASLPQDLTPVILNQFASLQSLIFGQIDDVLADHEILQIQEFETPLVVAI